MSSLYFCNAHARLTFFKQEEAKKIDQEEVRRALAHNLARVHELLGSSLLNTQEITQTEQAIDTVCGIVNSLHDYIKRLEASYCALGVRFACLQDHVSVQKRQINVAKGKQIQVFFQFFFIH